MMDGLLNSFRLMDAKARSGYPLKAFNNSLIEVGTGNYAVDTAALKAAAASRELIDLTGCWLVLEETITVDYRGANITALSSRRPGDYATSKITVVGNMPYVFDVAHQDFAMSNIHLYLPNNTSSTAFRFKRPDYEISDVDAYLGEMSIVGGKKAFHHYGRGLNIESVVFSGQSECCGDFDWPTNWTPSGQSNDLPGTAARAYYLNDIRVHGCGGGFRNIGANAQNMRGLVANGVHADTGCGPIALFDGVWKDAGFNQIRSNLNAVNGNKLFDFRPGSENCQVTNFHHGGWYDDAGSGANSRNCRSAITISASSSKPVKDLHFVAGTIGPCARDGFNIYGTGEVRNIVCNAVTWRNCNLEGPGYSPIAISDYPSYVGEASGFLSYVTMKLSACNFDSTLQDPARIIGGTNSSNFTVYKDTLTTKKSSIPWAQSNVNVV